jgi:hypothetical protein
MKMKAKFRKAVVLLGLIALMLGTMAPSCNQSDFERNAWVTLRDADAALESATSTWEQWKAESPRQFTDAELEQIRQVLSTGNEALATAEAGFSTYRATKRAVEAGQKTPADLEAVATELRQALDALTRAVTSVRLIVEEYGKKRAAAEIRAPIQAAVPLPLILLLISLLGEFLQAFLGGKKGAISKAAIALVAAVLNAHQQATGEDIDLAQPALRARIAERRKRLAKAA